MDRLTAPEFIWVTRSGEVSKEQFLQRLKSGDLAKYDLIGEQKVRFAGEVAIVTGARLLHSNPERKIMVTNVWIKKEGRWQRFSSHTSELPEPKK